MIRLNRGWELPESQATPEALFDGRRSLVKTLAAGPIVLGAPALLGACEAGRACARLAERPLGRFVAA